MKEYRGTEIIKASRFLQKMTHECEVLGKIIPLTKVQVEDRSARVFFEGEHDGKPLRVVVTVYRAVTYSNEYSATADGRVFQSRYGHGGFVELIRWINSICKLDTDEARDGTLEMRLEEWAIVHADFIREFIRKLNILAHNPDRVTYGVMVPWERQYRCTLCQHYYPMLAYDKEIHDFKKRDVVAEVGFQISYDAKKIYLIFGIDQFCDYESYEFLKKMFPDTVPALECFECNGRDGSARMVECNSIDEAAEKMKRAQETWEKHYDEIAKAEGMTRDWKKAKSWDWDGPEYEEGTPERETLDADKKIKEQKHGAVVIDETLRAMTARGFDLKTMFPDAEISYENDSVVLKISYKFPKIDGSKIKWKPATCDVQIKFFRDHNNREEFRVLVHDVAVYQTMHGVYDRFMEAKRNDGEKMMMIKPSRARRKYWYYDGYYNARQSMQEMREAIESIKPKIAELKEFAEYKGFKE
jgi:hypothetical protein